MRQMKLKRFQSQKLKQGNKNNVGLQCSLQQSYYDCFCSFSCCFYARQQEIWFLSVLLIITSFIEITVLILISKKIVFVWLYHLYNLVEYALLCLFLVPIVRSKSVAKLVKYSIPIFIVGGFLLSLLFYRFKGFPGLNINIEGILLFILCVYILFTLEVTEDTPVFKTTDLWICSGILIFFGTTFFYNGIYTRIVDIDEGQAVKLFSIINRPLNIILYSFIIIGILCLPKKLKPIIQKPIIQ